MKTLLITISIMLVASCTGIVSPATAPVFSEEISNDGNYVKETGDLTDDAFDCDIINGQRTWIINFSDTNYSDVKMYVGGQDISETLVFCENRKCATFEDNNFFGKMYTIISKWRD